MSVMDVRSLVGRPRSMPPANEALDSARHCCARQVGEENPTNHPFADASNRAAASNQPGSDHSHHPLSHALRRKVPVWARRQTTEERHGHKQRGTQQQCRAQLSALPVSHPWLGWCGEYETAAARCELWAGLSLRSAGLAMRVKEGACGLCRPTWLLLFAAVLHEAPSANIPAQCAVAGAVWLV